VILKSDFYSVSVRSERSVTRAPVGDFVMKWDSRNLTDLSVALDDRMQALLASLIHDPQYNGFGTIGIEGLELLSVSQETQSVRYAFTVVPLLCNKAGNLHGGAATTIFDTLTTSALLTIAKPGHWDTLGVSRALTVISLRTLPLGTKVFLGCEVVAAGKNMANLKGTMKTTDG